MIKRVTTPVTIDQARERLRAFRDKHGNGPYALSRLAEIVWPGVRFGSSQGAARAVSGVAKKCGAKYWTDGSNWGYMLTSV